MRIAGKLSRFATIFLLLVGSAWAALVNGQPLFMEDTSAYVRGPDFAVVHFLGNRFATAWTQERTLNKGKVSSDANPSDTKHVPLNSPYEKAVLAGRSIYYGAFLYLGYVSSQFWLCVFAQAAIFLYLCHTFIVKCLRLSFPIFAVVISFILVATPVSFFISFMMPDIFASFLILSAIMIMAFWNELERVDKIYISAILILAVLAHASHLLLLFLVGALCALIYIIVRRKPGKTAAAPVAVLFAVFFVGLVGEAVFSYATKFTVGVYPVRPPFLMARLIDDGPGQRFLQQNCEAKPYTICRYKDRLPTTMNYFLWSPDSAKGVYNEVDLTTRTALSAEEIPFIIDVIRWEPLGVINAAIRNAIEQLTTIGVAEFFRTPIELGLFKNSLPEEFFNRIVHSRFSKQRDILAPLNTWFSSVYFLSMAGLLLAWGLLPLIQFPNKSLIFPQPQWLYVLTIGCTAVLFNAAICGVLSTPAMRYQTRISWIPLFLLLVVIIKLGAALLPARADLRTRAV